MIGSSLTAYVCKGTDLRVEKLEARKMLAVGVAESPASSARFVRRLYSFLILCLAFL